MENTTEVTEFLLAGLSDDPEVQVLLCITFSLIYLLPLVGSPGIPELILLDSRLHTPVDFFLSQLSLVDFGYSSAVTPQVVAGFLTGDQTISYEACVAQLFFFVAFITVESFLLAAMAYDRHAAVCKPLHRAAATPTKARARLRPGCSLCGFLNAAGRTGNVSRLSFCRSSVVNRFFCDAPPLLALSCSDSYVSEMVILFVVGFNDLSSLLVIFISYLFIFITILRTRSSEGRQKAFSTCASHLTAVSIFYGTGIFMYSQPSSSHSLGTDKVASVFYAVVIPMLNPLVYSLRNKEVKSAFKTAVGKAKSSMGSVF